MNYEIVGPEVTQVTGQLRIPKDVAISKHIAQFWNEHRHQSSYPQTRKEGIKLISEKIGVPEDKLIEHTWEEHNLIAILWSLGNKEAAIQLANNPKLVRKQRPDLILEIAAYRKVKALNEWETIDNSLITVSRKDLSRRIDEIRSDPQHWIDTVLTPLETLTWQVKTKNQANMPKK